MHRGILKQCVMTRSYGNCHMRLSSVMQRLRWFFDDYDLYPSRMLVYRHVPTQTFEVVIAGLLISSIVMSCAVVVTGPFCCQKCRMSTTFIVLLTGVCVATACFVYWQANLEGQTFTLQHTPVHDLYPYEYSENVQRKVLMYDNQNE
ncbi:hypothetical protein COOONC_14219 [Cooperia oncophora]